MNDEEYIIFEPPTFIDPNFRPVYCNPSAHRKSTAIEPFPYGVATSGFEELETRQQFPPSEWGE